MKNNTKKYVLHFFENRLAYLEFNRKYEIRAFVEES